MQQATRTFFPNYFNGSEIVIAGKLVDGPPDRLHVEVTASNSEKFVVLQTDVPVGPPRVGSASPGGTGPGEAGQAGPNPLERAWSYLTVKEMLRSWLQSGAGREKERLRQEAQALAVTARFLTPVTRMKLEPVLQTQQGPDALGLSAATGPGTAGQSLPPGTGCTPVRAEARAWAVLSASFPGQGHPAGVCSIVRGCRSVSLRTVDFCRALFSAPCINA